MASNIDPTQPLEGDTTTLATRDNFVAAKDEIEALQDGKMAKAASGTLNNFVAFSDSGGINTKDSGLNNGSFDSSGAAAGVQSNLDSHAINSGSAKHVTSDELDGFDNANPAINAGNPVASESSLTGKMSKSPTSTVDHFVAFVSSDGIATKDSGLDGTSFDAAGTAAVVQGNLNAHENANNEHMTTDEAAAMDAANAPSGTNPVATVDDISGATNAHIIQNQGVDVQQEIRLNFTGPGVTAGPGAAGVTDVTIPGGAGGGATNLSNTPSATEVTIESDSGTNTSIVAAVSGTAGVMSGAQVDALSAAVTGPPGASDEALAIYDGISGDLLKESSFLISTVISNSVSAQFDNVLVDGAPVAGDKLLIEKAITGAKRHIDLADLPTGVADLTDATFPTYAVYAGLISADATVAFSDGNKQTVDAAVNMDLTLTAPGINNYMLTILNSGSLATITPTPEWENGATPSWAGKTILALYYDGTNWAGSAMVGVA